MKINIVEKPKNYGYNIFSEIPIGSFFIWTGSSSNTPKEAESNLQHKGLKVSQDCWFSFNSNELINATVSTLLRKEHYHNYAFLLETETLNLMPVLK